MSNYTKSTNFTAKDSLPTGDTNKVVRGSEFDTEFNAISVAVATKSDLAGPTFTGTATFDGITATGTVNFTGGSVTTNIDGGTIDGVTIGGSSAGAGTFSSLTATTADINAGTVDNTVIGGTTPAAGTFSSLTATTADINGGSIDGAVIGGSTPAAVSGTTGAFSGAVSGTTGTFSGAVTGSNLNVSNWDTAFGWGDHSTEGYLTSVTFSDMDAGAVTTSGETFANSDTQIPTNAAVRNWVLTTYPTIVELNDLTANVTWANVPDANITQSSVTQHQAALSITASQLSDVTATAAELNVLDGITATTAELNYTDGVTSNIQTQIDNINPSPTLTATASGTLANGDTVVINSDGTVSAVSENTITQVAGTRVAFEDGAIFYPRSAYDANAGKVVIAYSDSGNSGYGTAVVGTVDASDNSISFGTPVVFESAQTAQFGTLACEYDANAQKILIAYADNGNSGYGTAIVGTVSGTSISFGSVAVFESAEVSHVDSAYDDNAQKILIVYRDNGNSSYGTGIVATISGTSVSFGTPVVFKSDRVEQNTVVYDSSAQKHAVFFKDVFDSGKGKGIVATVSGTSVSYGTATDFDATGSAEKYGAVYDTSNSKIALGFDNGTDGKYIVGTISGTSISFGSQGTFNSGRVDDMSAVFDNVTNKVIFVWRYQSGASKLVSGTISGTSMSFDTTYEYLGGDTGNFNLKGAVWDDGAKRTVIAFRNADGAPPLDDDGMAVVFQTGGSTINITSENYIGISDAAYSDGATATIQIVGSVDDAQAGLIAGQSYYVQTDGSLGLTADNPEVFAGTAVSATKLIVKG